MLLLTTDVVVSVGGVTGLLLQHLAGWAKCTPKTYNYKTLLPRTLGLIELSTRLRKLLIVVRRMYDGMPAYLATLLHSAAGLLMEVPRMNIERMHAYTHPGTEQPSWIWWCQNKVLL